MTEASTLRDALRAESFSETIRTVQVQLGSNFIEVRQPTVGQMLEQVNVTDQRQRIARMIIDCCFVPGTSIKVYEDTDVDMLMALPATGIYSKLMQAITDLSDLNKVEGEQKKPSA